MSKVEWTFQGKGSFAHPEDLQMYSNKGLQNNCFTEKYPKAFTKTFFVEILVIGGCSKNSNNLFYKTSMDTSGWMKKR